MPKSSTQVVQEPHPEAATQLRCLCFICARLVGAMLGSHCTAGPVAVNLGGNRAVFSNRPAIAVQIMQQPYRSQKHQAPKSQLGKSCECTACSESFACYVLGARERQTASTIVGLNLLLAAGQSRLYRQMPRSGCAQACC